MNALGIVGIALVVIGLLNQGATVNGATALWITGLIIAFRATYPKHHTRA
jgi:hypothetical protein